MVCVRLLPNPVACHSGCDTCCLLLHTLNFPAVIYQQLFENTVCHVILLLSSSVTLSQDARDGKALT